MWAQKTAISRERGFTCSGEWWKPQIQDYYVSGRLIWIVGAALIRVTFLTAVFELQV